MKQCTIHIENIPSHVTTPFHYTYFTIIKKQLPSGSCLFWNICMSRLEFIPLCELPSNLFQNIVHDGANKSFSIWHPFWRNGATFRIVRVPLCEQTFHVLLITMFWRVEFVLLLVQSLCRLMNDDVLLRQQVLIHHRHLLQAMYFLFASPLTEDPIDKCLFEYM